MLRYPVGAGASGSDYVTFTPTNYRTNADEGPAPNNGEQAIVLYMPNSTPGIGNPNSWGDYQSPGPLGAARRDAGRTITHAITGVGGEGAIQGFLTDSVNALALGRNAKNAGGIAKQLALQAIPEKFLGGTPNQMMAMQKGQVYNPNVELIYQSPVMREFVFNFDFLPRNIGEAEVMNQIIKAFKSNSAPVDLNNGMFGLPMVWNVKYMSGAEENRYMNKFKPAACVGVSVQANSSADMHISTAAGVPVQTSLTLQFREVDIITREDHDQAPQGF